MSESIYLVHIYHIFIQRCEPIHFNCEEDVQDAIHGAIASCLAHAIRTFEFKTLEEAQLKVNETKDGFWQYDEGYARSNKWYYFEAEVAKIVEERFDKETAFVSKYYHPEILFDNSFTLVNKENI